MGRVVHMSRLWNLRSARRYGECVSFLCWWDSVTCSGCQSERWTRPTVIIPTPGVGARELIVMAVEASEKERLPFPEHG